MSRIKLDRENSTSIFIIILFPVLFLFYSHYCQAQECDIGLYSIKGKEFIATPVSSERPPFLLNEYLMPQAVKQKACGFASLGLPEKPPYLLSPERQESLWNRLARDYVAQVKAPFQYAGEHPLRFSLGVVGIGALLATDSITLRNLAPQAELSETGTVKIGKLLSQYGEVIYALPLIASFGAYGWLAESEREKETFLMITEALITTETWTLLLKEGVGRERPRQCNSKASDLNGPFGAFSSEAAHSGKRFASFPSGHSSAMFALATILAYQYPGYYIVPVLSYSAATAVAYSRMVVDAHWLSDIVVGSALGYFCARQVLRDNHVPVNSDDSRFTFTGLSLGASPDSYSLQLQFNW